MNIRVTCSGHLNPRAVITTMLEQLSLSQMHISQLPYSAWSTYIRCWSAEERSSEAVSRSASQEIPPTFIESEGSLQCSQEHVTGPYLEPPHSTPHPHILFIYDLLWYYPPIYA